MRVVNEWSAGLKPTVLQKSLEVNSESVVQVVGEGTGGDGKQQADEDGHRREGGGDGDDDSMDDDEHDDEVLEDNTEQVGTGGGGGGGSTRSDSPGPSICSWCAVATSS